MKEYDVSGMPPDVPFDDEAPYRYDDAGRSRRGSQRGSVTAGEAARRRD